MPMNCRKMRRNLEGHMAKATKKAAVKKPASKFIRKTPKAAKPSKKKAA